MTEANNKFIEANNKFISLESHRLSGNKIIRHKQIYFEKPPPRCG